MTELSHSGFLLIWAKIVMTEFSHSGFHNNRRDRWIPVFYGGGILDFDGWNMFSILVLELILNDVTMDTVRLVDYSTESWLGFSTGNIDPNDSFRNTFSVLFPKMYPNAVSVHAIGFMDCWKESRLGVSFWKYIPNANFRSHKPNYGSYFITKTDPSANQCNRWCNLLYKAWLGFSQVKLAFG